MLYSLLALVLFIGASSFAAEVVTDAPSYLIGTYVDIDGLAFGTDEFVTIQVTELDGAPISGASGMPWSVSSDALGGFVTTWLVDYQGTSSELLLTAAGQTSGETATTTFVAGTTNLDQLQNGTTSTPPEWANGNINSSNSCYSEGRAVPYRAFITDQGSGTAHFFTIEMEWTKATVHAFDFLASYDFSEDSAITLAGGPCGNVGTSAPGDCFDPTDSLVLPSPDSASNYSGSIPGDFYPGTYQYNDTNYLMAYNAVIDSVGDYYFGGTSSDRTWAVEVYYTQVGTGTVGFYWGGNLSEGDPDHWDYGNGSASVGGAPYHMRMVDFDGGGGANQDRSIQNGTICLPPQAVILIDTDSLCFDIDTTYTAYDTSDANDWLWTVTNGTIIGDSTLSSVEFSVDGAGTVTVELRACNTDGGCPGEFCCASLSETWPTKSCCTTVEVTCPDSIALVKCDLGDICIGGFSSVGSDSCSVDLGTLTGTTVCFTPVEGNNVITYTCLNSCGNPTSCQTVVNVTLIPVCEVSCPPGDTLLVCDLSDICVDGFSDDCVSSTINGVAFGGGQYCFTPVEGDNILELIGTDACGRADTCQTLIRIDLNRPPDVTCPPGVAVTTCTTADEVCVGAFVATDDDGNLMTTLLNGQPYTPGGQYCFAPDSGINLLIFTAIDSCGASATCTTLVEVEALPIEDCNLCPSFTIEKTHGSIQGLHEYVGVTVDSSDILMGGYDLLIAYDASALNLQAVIPGPPFYDPAPDGCGWEYFIYRQGPCGACAGGCPSGMVRVFGLAETNNGPNHPSCFLPDSLPATLFSLDFLVNNDRTFECQYAPVSFYWCDCADNTVSSVDGNTLYMDLAIYDFEDNLIWDEDDDDQFPEDARIPWVGAPDYCLVPNPGKPTPQRCLTFKNGGVDIVCADSIDARGDINLNGNPNEIADAVLFSNYFVHGISVFNVNIDGQIAASDVNADGITLSVADLVYLIRIIVGDAVPYFKQAPLLIAANLAEGVLSVDVPLGAAWMVVAGDQQPQLLATNMEMKFAYDAREDMTRILVYSLEKDHTFDGAFVAGLEGEIVKFEAATYEGIPVTAKLVPDQFALYPSYPNPFNPVTTIAFALAEATDYELTIYNALGREVQTFRGRSTPGIVEIQWDAGGHASGIYLYRLKAGTFAETRKMVLLK